MDLPWICRGSTVDLPLSSQIVKQTNIYSPTNCFSKMQRDTRDLFKILIFIRINRRTLIEGLCLETFAYFRSPTSFAGFICLLSSNLKNSQQASSFSFGCSHNSQNEVQTESLFDAYSTRVTMAYCKQNLTIGIYTVEGSGLLELENNRITGLIGKQYDRFLNGRPNER